jgi:hypothetical protein
MLMICSSSPGVYSVRLPNTVVEPSLSRKKANGPTRNQVGDSGAYLPLPREMFHSPADPKHQHHASLSQGGQKRLEAKT